MLIALFSSTLSVAPLRRRARAVRQRGPAEEERPAEEEEGHEEERQRGEARQSKKTQEDCEFVWPSACGFSYSDDHITPS